MKPLNLILIIFFSIQSFAAKTTVVDSVELTDQDVRLQICEDIIYDYHDYGEFFDMDEGGTDFVSFCDDSSIYMTSTVTDKFPEGSTPEGFSDEIITKYNFKAELEEDLGVCTGWVKRNLPRAAGFTINDNGEIKPVSQSQGSWSVVVEECE